MPEQEPDSLSGRNQVKAKLLSDRLWDRRASLRKAAGEPFSAEQLSPTERKQQYIDMISSKDLLFNSLAGAAIVGRDGKLRISTTMVNAFIELGDKK